MPLYGPEFNLKDLSSTLGVSVFLLRNNLEVMINRNKNNQNDFEIDANLLL